MEEFSDSELCQRVFQGHRDALELLYRRHAHDIIYYLKFMGAPPDWVEDGTHEVFLKVWHALERGQQPVAFRVWIRRIAHNVLVDHWRRPEQRREVLGIESDEGRVLDLDTAVDVNSAMDQLEWSLREILVLHFYQDLTLQEISTIVNIPLGTVKSRLARAYRHLAKIVRDGDSGRSLESRVKGDGQR